MRASPTLLILLLAASGCSTMKVKSPVAAQAVARVAKTEKIWRVTTEAGEEPLGYVVFFRSENAAQDSLYVVRNRWHQDLGMIDGFGRAYRYRPHQEEAQWIGSGTVRQGALRILSAPASGRLIEDSISGAPNARAASSPPMPQVRPESRATSAAEEGSS